MVDVLTPRPAKRIVGAMTTITFDTLKFVERLRAVGIPEAHAKAEAEALVEALSSGAQELTTKGDLRDLERRLESRILESRFDLLKWVVGLALAQMGLLIGILIKLL